MKNTKAKYDFKSAELKSIGISVKTFVADPAGAIWDAAGDIGEDKGYGSEGIGELHEELWGQIGLPAEAFDNGEYEFLGFDTDDVPYTIDGKLPDVKALLKAKLTEELKQAKDEVKRLTKELAAASK